MAVLSVPSSNRRSVRGWKENYLSEINREIVHEYFLPAVLIGCKAT